MAGGEGGTSHPLLLPARWLKDSPGMRKRVQLQSPPYLHLHSMPLPRVSWKGLAQVTSPGETPQGLEHQPREVKNASLQ